MVTTKKTVAKDWWKTSKSNETPIKNTIEFDSLKVKAVSDLPTLLTTKEAAQILKRHPKTVEELRNDKRLKFIKVMGRWFTTPEFIGEFLEFEFKKNA